MPTVDVIIIIIFMAMRVSVCGGVQRSSNSPVVRYIYIYIPSRLIQFCFVVVV